MEIKEIKLLTSNIEAVREFYYDILDIPIVSSSKASMTFQIGKSRLSFVKTESTKEPYYHFAFNITENKVLEAISWLNRKGIVINKVNNNDVVYSQSWNSDSIYFYDSVGNIVELIARHNQTNKIMDEFDYYDLINISEIGFPTDDVINLSNLIQRLYKEQVYMSSDSMFSPIGDEEGLLILSSTNRNWLGSNKKVEIFPLEVVIAGDTNGTNKLLDYPYIVNSES